MAYSIFDVMNGYESPSQPTTESVVIPEKQPTFEVSSISQLFYKNHIICYICHILFVWFIHYGHLA